MSALARIGHGNIVRLLDAGDDAHGPWLVIEHVEGVDVAALLDALRAGWARLEASDGRTVFLDEIGELPSRCSPGLLRAIGSRAVRRIGSFASTASSAAEAPSEAAAPTATARRARRRRALLSVGGGAIDCRPSHARQRRSPPRRSQRYPRRLRERRRPPTPRAWRGSRSGGARPSRASKMRQGDVAASMVDIGEALVELKAEGVAEALGRAGFAEVVTRDLGMAITTAHALVALSTRVSRALAT